jgi:hypothetical protein
VNAHGRRWVGRQAQAVSNAAKRLTPTGPRGRIAVARKDPRDPGERRRVRLPEAVGPGSLTATGRITCRPERHRAVPGPGKAAGAYVAQAEPSACRQALDRQWEGRLRFRSYRISEGYQKPLASRSIRHEGQNLTPGAHAGMSQLGGERA